MISCIHNMYRLIDVYYIYCLVRYLFYDKECLNNLLGATLLNSC